MLAELQTESDRAMAEKGVDVATLRREEQKLQKLKKEQKQAIESRSDIENYDRWFTNHWSQKPLLEEKVTQCKTQLESNQLKWQGEEKQFKQQIEQLQVELTSCVFRFVRPPVPVSSGQAFRCDPASMI